MALHIPLLSAAEIEAGATSDGTPLPPVPVPTSPSDLPPDKSDPLVVGTSKEKLLYWWDWDHGDVQLWIPGPPAPQPIPNSQWETASFYGPFPDYTLTRRLFWSRVDYQRVDGGGSYTRAETTTEGMSSTEETSISAELDVGVEDLGGKLSAAFSQSITVSEEKSVTNSWGTAGIDGKITIWILWQLFEEIVGLEANGRVVGGWPYGTCGAYITWVLGGTTPGDTSIRTPRVTQGLHAYQAVATRFPEA